MSTLILYATKNGATRDIAQRIAKNMDNATLHDLKAPPAPNLADFDCVIIGSPLYAGSIRREARVFVSKHADALLDKNFGLFLSGMDDRDVQSAFNSNFSANLLEAANATAFLGGAFDPEKSGVFGRLIMKVVTKQSGYVSTINDDEIKEFAEFMKV